MKVHIHPTAEVSQNTQIADGVSIWHHAQVRDGVKIGSNSIIGKGVYLDEGVPIGRNVKIQNYVSVYHGVVVEDGVFIGPHVCFTNDLRPRAVNPDGSIKAADDWILGKTVIKRGAAIGANSTIRCGITIGEWAMIGSGSVVTKDVPSHGLLYGNPATIRGFVCACGEKFQKESIGEDFVKLKCPICGRSIDISILDWNKQK